MRMRNNLLISFFPVYLSLSWTFWFSFDEQLRNIMILFSAVIIIDTLWINIKIKNKYEIQQKLQQIVSFTLGYCVLWDNIYRGIEYLNYL